LISTNSSIIYRDLKPNNIGFDVRDDVKIFDFGLATEYDPHKVNKNSAFKLTGDTGTIRYMAPEVALKQRYDETADVYSFSVLLWEMIALKDPYEGLSDQAVERKVIYAGHRPKIDPQWSNGLRRLMHDCFASSPRRPHMDLVCDVLRQEINKLSDKKLVDAEVVDSARSAMSARH
jgi:serine/threonine protein kinase